MFGTFFHWVSGECLYKILWYSEGMDAIGSDFAGSRSWMCYWILLMRGRWVVECEWLVRSSMRDAKSHGWSEVAQGAC